MEIIALFIRARYLEISNMLIRDFQFREWNEFLFENGPFENTPLFSLRRVFREFSRQLKILFVQEIYFFANLYFDCFYIKRTYKAFVWNVYYSVRTIRRSLCLYIVLFSFCLQVAKKLTWQNDKFYLKVI